MESALQWRRPSPLLLSVRRVQVAIATVAVAVASGLAGSTAGAAAAAGAAVGAIGMGVAAEWFVRRRVHAWG